MNDDHYRKLERMYASAPLNRFFEPTLVVQEGRADVSTLVRPEFFHAAHAIHGCVYFKMLDDAAFFAVNSLVTEVFVLTVSFTVYLTRPVSSGVLRSSGRVVHRSKNLYLAESELFDGEGRHAGRGNGSFMRSAIPLAPEVGYA
jgi:uncharacterized protein (TIGR00369 family)